MKELLPAAVFGEVSHHLRMCGRHAHRDWEVNQAHEDSLTRAAFADFQTRRTRRVYVNEERETSFNNSIVLETLWKTLSSQPLTVFLFFGNVFGDRPRS